MIWPDWFAAEPEEGSNPDWAEKKKKKQLAKEQADICYTDTNQPLDYNLR